MLHYHKYNQLKSQCVTTVLIDEYAIHQVDDVELVGGRWCKGLNKRRGIDNCTAMKNNLFLLFLLCYLSLSLWTFPDFWIPAAVVLIIFIDPTYK